MDKLKPNDWIVAAGGALVLVFGLVRWFSWEVTVEEVVATRGKSNAFDYFFTGVVPWMLIAGTGVVTVLLATEALRPGKIPWPLVLLAATALGFVLIVIRLIIAHDPATGSGADADVSRGLGVWMSALGGLVAVVGAFIGFRNEGLDTEYKPASGRPQPDREIPPTTS
ncbi:MAG: hypothetical protein ACRD0G_05340 [Acidimicrobiales bacterium]